MLLTTCLGQPMRMCDSHDLMSLRCFTLLPPQPFHDMDRQSMSGINRENAITAQQRKSSDAEKGVEHISFIT